MLTQIISSRKFFFVVWNIVNWQIVGNLCFVFFVLSQSILLCGLDVESFDVYLFSRTNGVILWQMVDLGGSWLLGFHFRVRCLNLHFEGGGGTLFR